MIKWRPSCRILKRLNFLFCLKFIQYKDFLFKNYDLRSLDVKKNSILASKVDILHFNGIHNVFVFFLMIKWSSDNVLVTVNEFSVHSRHVIRCCHLRYTVFCLANVNINTLPAYFYDI